MTEVLTRLRDRIQEDVGQRGLARDPHDNLLTACADDFAAACHRLAEASHSRVLVVTGFPITSVTPPCEETDGPLGAVFLARTFIELGISVRIRADGTARTAIAAALDHLDLSSAVNLSDVPSDPLSDLTARETTHRIALERVGPSHMDGRCYSMRGRDVTAFTKPAHHWFENRPAEVATIGIGDGGNEIGMGKVPWEVIRRNIPQGDRVACRVPTDHLIVAGVSNWGAYALAVGVARLRGRTLPRDWFDGDRERALLRLMTTEGPLVDGVTGRAEATVDGIPWPAYAAVLADVFSIAERSA